ncbi:MAG: (d)CMP kinase [Clostridia bacterium]|nr:(d)CMP kinase [Clostridia bacterium]
MINIAIDGPSGAGKSTISKAIAKHFGFVHIDTGALYRTVALYVFENNINMNDEKSVAKALENIDIKVAIEEDLQKIYLNGKDVGTKIREPNITKMASDISKLKIVRDFLLDVQRKLAKENDCVMDGRDIGTVVLPDSDVKIFLTASPEVRAKRRLLQQEEMGIFENYEKILEDIKKRDYNDSHREIAPLKQAEDAIKVDSSEFSFEQIKQKCKNLIDERLKNGRI